VFCGLMSLDPALTPVASLPPFQQRKPTDYEINGVSVISRTRAIIRIKTPCTLRPVRVLRRAIGPS
jgi:hypothetical protein